MNYIGSSGRTATGVVIMVMFLTGFLLGTATIDVRTQTTVRPSTPAGTGAGPAVLLLENDHPLVVHQADSDAVNRHFDHTSPLWHGPIEQESSRFMTPQRRRVRVMHMNGRG